jgi:phosphoglycolate phosphatase-like HAD superfamily hydrolase
MKNKNDIRIYFDLDNTIWYARSVIEITPFDVLQYEGLLDCRKPYNPTLDEKIASLANVGVTFPNMTREKIANLLHNSLKVFKDIMLPLIAKWPENWASVQFDGSRELGYVAVIRPGIVSLLHKLKDRGFDLRVCTASTAEYCIPLLKQFGVFNLFSEILTRTDLYVNQMSKTSYSTDFLLIDDLDLRDLEFKFNTLMGNSNVVADLKFYADRHIKALPFYGLANDVGAAHIASDLNEKLGVWL